MFNVYLTVWLILGIIELNFIFLEVEKIQTKPRNKNQIKSYARFCVSVVT